MESQTVKQIYLSPEDVLPETEIAAREGSFVQESELRYLLGEGDSPPAGFRGEFFGGPAAIYRPGGELLCAYFPGEISPGACAAAFRALRALKTPITNRGTAAGVSAAHHRRSDGRLSYTREVAYRDPANIRLRGVGSSIVGALERGPRFPMCRLSAFQLNHPERFKAALPFFREISSVFAARNPERFRAQMELVEKTHPAWRIHGTAFTTVTVNKNFRTAIHKDAGDLPAGFGVMTVLRAGSYRGCYTAFPGFRCGVDMRTRGVMLADVHEWHANTPIVGHPGQFERIACVFYYRAKMARCASPSEEVARAAGRKRGEPLWGEKARN